MTHCPTDDRKTANINVINLLVYMIMHNDVCTLFFIFAVLVV